MTEEDSNNKDLKVCECGYCNELIPSINKQGKPARFKNGHNSKGKNNYSWNGGKRLDYRGYVLVYSPGHPHAHNNFVLEHRLIMEKILDRTLEDFELVHHINADRTDNRPENLKLMTNSEHISHHHKGKKVSKIDMSARRCCDCKSLGREIDKRRWYKINLVGFVCPRCYKKRVR